MLYIIILVFHADIIGQIRLLEVDPTNDRITIKNFGGTTVDISSYRLCALIVYNPSPLSTYLESGSLNLAAGTTVVLSGWPLTDAASDLGIYVNANFASSTSMVDFTQWGSGGNGRESVAVAKGIWSTGDFICGSDPFNYIGDGTQNGLNYWIASTTPVLDQAKVIISDLSSCNSLDGSLAATDPSLVTTPGGEPAGGYTFEWWIGTIASGVANFTGTTYSNLDAGDYTLVATNNDTGCEAAPVTVTVLDNTAIPVINNSLNPNTACDPLLYDGSISASNGGVVTGNTFEWFTGTGTGTPFVDNTDGVISGTNGEIISGLGPGNYTVRVTVNATLCASQQTFAILDNSTIPVIDQTKILITDRTLCSSLNGSLAATDPLVVSDPGGEPSGGYTFEWWIGTSATGPADFPGTNYSNLDAGSYTLVATNNDTGCGSAPVTLTVQDDTVIPVIDSNSTHNTACDPLLYNGSISASNGGVVTGNTFDWFVGTDTNTPFVDNTDGVISGTNGETISELADGDYVARVTEDVTGCASTQTFSILDNSTGPVIDQTKVIISDRTSCSTINGSLAATDILVVADPGGEPGSGYTFEWWIGTAATGVADFTGTTYENLDIGSYTLVATNNDTGCGSIPVTLTVSDNTNTVLPVINSSLTHNTACDPLLYNGTISASNGSVVAGNTFEWFVGTDTSTPFADNTDGVISGTNGETISGLAARDYALRVIETVTGCASTQTIAVLDTALTPVIDQTKIIISDRTSCSSINGSLSATDILVVSDPGGEPGSGYTFEWWIGTTDTGATDFTGITYSNLDAGSYTLVATNNDTGCGSTPVTLTVSDITNTVLPVITTSITHNTACDPLLYNGSISASNGGVVTGNTFEWFVGTDTSTPFVDNTDGVISGTNGETISGLAAGDYAARVTEDATGCAKESVFMVSEMIEVITISSPTIEDNTSCDGFNGSITVDTITPGALSDYTFAWYTGSSVDVNAQITGQTGASLTNIEPDLYTMVATNSTNLCESSPITVVVTDGSDCVTALAPDVGEAGEIQLNIYPSPSNQNIQINFNNQGKGLFDFKVVDMSGKIILTGANQTGHEVTLERSGLKVGMFVLMLSLDGRVYTSKFMVN